MYSQINPVKADIVSKQQQQYSDNDESDDKKIILDIGSNSYLNPYATNSSSTYVYTPSSLTQSNLAYIHDSYHHHHQPSSVTSVAAAATPYCFHLHPPAIHWMQPEITPPSFTTVYSNIKEHNIIRVPNLTWKEKALQVERGDFCF